MNRSNKLTRDNKCDELIEWNTSQNFHLFIKFHLSFKDWFPESFMILLNIWIFSNKMFPISHKMKNWVSILRRKLIEIFGIEILEKNFDNFCEIDFLEFIWNVNSICNLVQIQRNIYQVILNISYCGLFFWCYEWISTFCCCYPNFFLIELLKRWQNIENFI